MQHHIEKIHAIELHGLEHLSIAIEKGQGILIAPNHFAYADPYLLFAAADRVGRPFYFMTAWQVFGTASWIKRFFLQRHGCFSVDREDLDVPAFKVAVDILQKRPHPLVIFPEGEMYHVGDRVTPFREGPAAIALGAARRAERPVVCIPCALKYYFRADPTPALARLTDQLEQRLYWRPRPDLPLAERILRLAEGALALKEIEYLGKTSSGPLRNRLADLCDVVLRNIESRNGQNGVGSVPERVTALRRTLLHALEALRPDAPERLRCHRDLDDVFLAVQLFCYPGDYLAERPTIERAAETLDKLEEDLLGVPVARPRAARGAVVVFGEPMPIPPQGDRQAAAELTHLLQRRVQALLDGIITPSLSPNGTPPC